MQAEHPHGQIHALLPRPRSLGKYRLLGALGQGGMARVVLALVPGPARINKLTVLKILRDDLSVERAALRRAFVAEARLSARFCDPHLVQTFEAEQIDGQYVLAMEYLEGQTYHALNARAFRRGGLPLEEHLRILACVALGLHYAHTLADFDGQPLGVVHRDVSPHNVFVTYDGQVKLLDFGIAQTRDSQREAQPRLLEGRLDYMAPEQLVQRRVDARADVFSLGAMLWEAISGQRFGGGREVDDATKARTRVRGGELSIRRVCPEVPSALAELCDYALARDPVWRLDHAAGFADALERYLEQSAQKPSARTLAANIAPLFRSERQKTRTMIEQHLQELALPASDIAASLPLPRAGTQRPLPRRVLVSLLLALGMLGGAVLAWYTPSNAPAPRAEPAQPARAALAPVLAR